MLRQVAEGVLIHRERFVQSDAVVVHDQAGMLLIDPGVHDNEIAYLANDPFPNRATVRPPLLDASSSGSPSLARQVRCRAPSRHRPLRGCGQGAVGTESIGASTAFPEMRRH